MTHLKQVLKNSFFLVNAQITIAVVAIVFLAITTRLLSKEEMAIVASFFIISAIVFVVSQFGFPAATIREVPGLLAAGKHKKANQFIKGTVIYPLFLAGILSILLISGAEYISLRLLKSPAYVSEVKIIILVVFLVNIFNLLVAVLQSLQRFAKISGLLIFVNIAQRVLALGLFFIWRMKGFLWGWALGTALSISLALWLVRDHLFVSSSGLVSFRKYFTFSLPYYLNAYSNYLVAQVDQLIVGLWLSPQILAVYYVCRRFFDFSSYIIRNLLDPLTVKIAELKAYGLKEIRKITAQTSHLLSFVIIPFGTILALASYPVLRVIGGTKYLEGWPILSILSLSLIFYAFFLFFSIYVYILDKPKKRFYLEMIVGGSQLFLNIILINFFGALGVAAAVLLSSIFGAFLARHWSKQKLTHPT